MRRTSLLTLATLALLGAAPLAAQAGNSCAARGAKLPASGAWSEYKTTEGTMRMLYLGKESAGERLELSVSGSRGAMVMQMVVPSYPYEMTDVKEMVMQRGTEPPMRMPEQMLAMMRSRMPNASSVSEESCRRMTEVGKERITVPAGTFQTTHYRDSTGGTDVWVAASVPFGAVKVVSRDHTLELTGNGTGGTTKLTGTPQDMPMGGPGGRPRGR
jgi:hypothetical protein